VRGVQDNGGEASRIEKSSKMGKISDGEVDQCERGKGMREGGEEGPIASRFVP
jgi:hypothetical protein